MKHKKRLMYLGLSLLIMVYAILKDYVGLDESFREWSGNVLKIPFIYFFCGIFYTEIKLKHLLFIVLIVVTMGLLDFAGNSFAPVFERIIGNLIGGGVLGLILYLIDRRTKAKE